MKSTKIIAPSDKIVEAAYLDTRRGAYIRISKGNDYSIVCSLAEKDPDNWIAITAREVVAQVEDQLGNYRRSSGLATLDVADNQLDKLENELPARSVDDTGARGDALPAAARLAQARAGLALQCAVVQIRRNKVESREKAVKIVDKLISLLTDYQDRMELKFEIFNWIMFWRGRIFSTVATIPEASESFKALVLADSNLEIKLNRDRADPDRCRQQVAASNYMISAILGFGMAHIRQLELKHDDSLRYLDIAIPLARGNNEDLYRLGYVNYLAGLAKRSLSQKESRGGEPEAARRKLQIAYVCFGGREKEVLGSDHLPVFLPPVNGELPQHHLHLARTLHQLALWHLNLDPSPDGLRMAWDRNLSALEETENEHCREFRDPVLQYGIYVLRSLARTGLAASGGGRDAKQNEFSFEEARRDAQCAIDMLAADTIPVWLHGASHVAKGRAIAGSGGRPSKGVIKEAKQSFEQALTDKTRITERAAAHLYLARLLALSDEHSNEAGILFDQAQDLIPQSEHGWVRRLSDEVGKELGEQKTAFVRVNVGNKVLELLAEKSKGGDDKKKIWKELSDQVMQELRDQVMRVYRPELGKEGGIKAVSRQLGMSEAALYGWRKAEEHRHLGLNKRNPRSKSAKNEQG